MPYRIACLACLLIVGSAFPVAMADESKFSYDFAALKPGWGKGSEAVEIGRDKLTLRADADKMIRLLNADRRFSDVDFRVQVTQSAGAGESSGGVLFWAVSLNDYYLAVVDSKGGVSVTRKEGGRLRTVAAAEPSPTIRTGFGKGNELRVVLKADVATVFVNGQEAFRVRGFPPPEPTRIGVYADGGTDQAIWEFAGMRVEGSNQPAEAGTPRDAALLFADDFSFADAAWGSPDEFFAVQDGKLLLKCIAKRELKLPYRGRLFNDIDARVTLMAEQGDVDAAGGIVFWATDLANCYVAQVDARGRFAVVRVVDGQPLVPVSQRACPSLRSGLNERNEMRIVTSGNWAVIMVNDCEITRFRGFPPAGGHRIGLMASAGDNPAVLSYTGLSVRTGPPAAGGQTVDQSILFSDDFLLADPSWDLKQMGQIGGGKLILSGTPNVSEYVNYNGAFFRDADIRATLTRVSESEQSKVHLFFREIVGEHLCCVVSGKGEVMLYRYDHAERTTTFLINQQDHAAFRRGVGVANDLRIVARDKNITVYLNGTEVGTAVVSPTLREPGGVVSISAEGKSDKCCWQVTDFQIRKPPE